MFTKKLSSATLLTSNLNKLKEFKAYVGDALTMRQGADIKEVSSDADTVSRYKSLDAGANTIVEDTVLIVDGNEVVDIRYQLDNLKTLTQHPDCLWQVTLAFNDGEHIYLFKGITSGRLKPVADVPHDAFGFDPNFYPKGSASSLYTLDKQGEKQTYSARRKALEI
jgi:inosine/xanthosine triphosphate pyrophosphatase family protein